MNVMKQLENPNRHHCERQLGATAKPASSPMVSPMSILFKSMNTPRGVALRRPGNAAHEQERTACWHHFTESESST
jgi:hypothetical protein